MSNQGPRARLAPTGVECLVYFSFGMPIAMLGVAWPQIRDGMERSNGELGLLAAAYGLGRMSTSAIGGRLLGRLKFGPATALGTGLLGVAIASVAVAPTWSVLVVTVALLGLTSGVLDSLGARFLAIQRVVATAGLITGSYGIGATLGPGVVAVSGSWRLSFAGAAVVALGVAVIVARWPGHWPEALEHEGRPVRETGSVPVPLTGGATHRGRSTGSIPTAPLLISLALFFLFVGVEVTAGQWMAALFEDARGASPRLSGFAVSAFWAGVTVGRLLLGRVRLSDASLVAAALGVAGLVGSTAFIPRPLLLPAMALAGLALSPTVPTLFARTADRIGADGAPKVSGWQLIAANASGIALPALTGVLVVSIGDLAPAAVVTTIAASGAILLAISARMARLATGDP